jgi:hypothetical protein
MEETKRCPYCGEEILAVAKKCRHCGEWLDGSHQGKKHIPSPLNECHQEEKERPSSTTEDKRLYVFIGIAVIIISVFFICYYSFGCAPSHDSGSSGYDSLNNDDITTDINEQHDDTEYCRDSLKSIYDVVENGGESIFFCLNGTDGCYSNQLTIFNAKTHETRTTDICQFAEFYPDAMHIKDYSVIDGTITFIISDGTRNSTGGFLSSTQVWKYSAKTSCWTDLDPGGDGCAGANFIDDKTKVEFKIGTVLNEETASCVAEYEYSYHKETIDL